mgnify:CR=1 FL=1
MMLKKGCRIESPLDYLWLFTDRQSIVSIVLSAPLWYFCVAYRGLGFFV